MAYKAMESIDNKQIIKNAVFLYIRTIFMVIFMLISSRILLKGLGSEDFGLYNLVGSIVAMFTSLRVIFASATQRFLNYEKSKQDYQILSNIFTISKRIHYGLSLIFLIITEVLGLWAIHNYLNIPDNRIIESCVILQCSVFSAIAMLMTVPYDAVIISNEKFNAYAYLAILECFLQLTAAIVVMAIPHNKLIWYSIIILFIAIIVRVVNMLYCKYSFTECKLKGNYDRTLLISMSRFAGWNFLGNFAISICNEGINVIINIFGGVIANAATAISMQVHKGIGAISERMSTAFAPQATQQFSIAEYQKFHNIVFLSTKLINYTYLIIGVPVIIFAPTILQLWLEIIPEYTIEFVRAIIIYGFARSIHSPLNMCFQCYGHLKKYQIVEICNLLPALPLAYIMLKNGFPLYWAILVLAITNFVNNVAIIILAVKQWGFRAVDFATNTIIPIIRVIIISTIFSYPIMMFVGKTYLQIILIITIIILSIVVFGLSNDERNRLFKLARNNVRTN